VRGGWMVVRGNHVAVGHRPDLGELRCTKGLQVTYPRFNFVRDGWQSHPVSPGNAVSHAAAFIRKAAASLGAAMIHLSHITVQRNLSGADPTPAAELCVQSSFR
jgi:hypothetical protein